MFQFSYLFVILLAVLPLGRTLLNASSGGSPLMFVHRLYRDLAYVQWLFSESSVSRWQ
jgi:hypothetical protein